MRSFIKRTVVFVMIVNLIFLCGCSHFQMPVFVFDDKSASELILNGLSNLSDFSCDISVSSVMSVNGISDSFFGKGLVEGNVNTVIHGTYENIDLLSNQSGEWYTDVISDTFYTSDSDNNWIAYSGGKKVYDIAWWSSQIKDGHLHYRSCDDELIIDGIYSGDALKALMDHIGIQWNSDYSLSDMELSVYANRWTGAVSQMIINTVDSGVPLTVQNNGKEFAIDSFEWKAVFDNDSVNCTLPDELAGLKPAGTFMGSVSSEIDGESLVFDNYHISFEENEIFDVINIDEDSKQLHVSSSRNNIPEIVISIENISDAYTAASYDAESALIFYNDNGLSEIAVTDVIQTLINDRVCYWYSSQYTDFVLNYVNTNYNVYIDLDDMAYVMIRVSDIVDPGVGVVLNDDYIRSILNHVCIEEG